MKLSQAEVAAAWGVSRAIICRYVARGMPLTSLWDAERWIGANVYRHKIRFRASESCYSGNFKVNPPVPQAAQVNKPERKDPLDGLFVEGNPRFENPAWELTPEEFEEVCRRVREDREYLDELAEDLKEAEAKIAEIKGEIETWNKHMDFGIGLAYWRCPGGVPTEDKEPELCAKLELTAKDEKEKV